MTEDPWVTCRYINGPGLVAWLEARGALNACKRQAERRINHWRGGVNARWESADQILTAVGIYLWELPDELWLDAGSDSSAESVRMP